MLWPDMSPAEPSNLLVFAPTVLGIYKCATDFIWHWRLSLGPHLLAGSPMAEDRGARIQESKILLGLFYNGLSLSKTLEPL